MRAPLHAPSNAFLPREGARRTQPLPSDFVTRRCRRSRARNAL
jgi:hypothetical protein